MNSRAERAFTRLPQTGRNEIRRRFQVSPSSPRMVTPSPVLGGEGLPERERERERTRPTSGSSTRKPLRRRPFP